MSFASKQVSLAALEHDEDSCCVVSPSLRILYCNPAWDNFARSHAGGDAALGRNLAGKELLRFIPEVLRPFFAEHLHRTLTGVAVWEHDYECSTPTQFRVFRLQALALTDTAEVLLCHEQVAVSPHFRTPVRSYGDGTPVRMCSHCRRSFRMLGPGKWEWIPEFLADPPANRVDDLCEHCLHYYGSGRNPWPESIWRPAA